MKMARSIRNWWSSKVMSGLSGLAVSIVDRTAGNEAQTDLIWKQTCKEDVDATSAPLFCVKVGRGTFCSNKDYLVVLAARVAFSKVD